MHFKISARSIRLKFWPVFPQSLRLVKTTSVLRRWLTILASEPRFLTLLTLLVKVVVNESPTICTTITKGA